MSESGLSELLERENRSDSNWIAEEFRYASLGDYRREKRLLILGQVLWELQGQSLSVGFNSASDYRTMTRFMGNEHFESEDILASHRHATLHTRVRHMERVLALSDTSELDLSSIREKVKGLGHLMPNMESKRGLLLHSTMMSTDTGIPLGFFELDVWARDPDEAGKSEKRKTLRIEDKESFKWLRSLRSTARAATQVPETTFIWVADREADIFDVFAEPRPDSMHVLVRSTHDRLLEEEPGVAKKLRDALLTAPLAGRYVVNVPRQSAKWTRGKRVKGRKARKARVELRYTRVTLAAMSRRNGESFEATPVYAVQVRELKAPRGAEPLNWILLTSLPLESLDDAQDIVTFYRYRWRIETYHEVLKSGFAIENYQFSTIPKLERLIVLCSVMAWRILFLKGMAQSVPELSATLVLEDHELRALRLHFHRRFAQPLPPPSIAWAVIHIARLGGYLNRKHDPPPGHTYLWRGLRRLFDFAQMHRLLTEMT